MNIIVFIVIFYSQFSTSDFLVDCSMHLFILACKHFTEYLLMVILNPGPHLVIHSYIIQELV